MKFSNEILSAIKKYYVKASIEYTGNKEMKKALQSIGICLLFFKNSEDNKYAIRDSRNLIYDMLKEIKTKEGKKLLKGLLKIIK